MTRELPWQREMMMRIAIEVAQEFATSVLDHQDTEGSADALRKRCATALAEVRQGPYFSQVFFVVVARKPC